MITTDDVLLCCMHVCVEGGKKRLLDKVLHLNKSFYSAIHRSLLGADIQYVHHKMSGPDDNAEVTSILDFSISCRVFRQLLPAQPFTVMLMKPLLNLLKSRGDRIKDTHKEIYEIPPRPKNPIDTALFFSSMDEAGMGLNVTTMTAQVAFVYILSHDANSNWYLIYIDVRKGTVSSINPAFGLSDFDQCNAANATAKAERIMELMRIPFPDRTFSYARFSHQFYQPNQDNFSSGLYVFLIIYYLELKCPIHFRSADLAKMRLNVAYWILINQLPY